ncbi:F-BAR domain only protein 1 [Emydura macquarii macquarii]|uniref:F-BAR domain only protein 1 n=1 Tax=Emydura macquarii macquarii TaxID=1129001 RepID=UPI00352BA7BB
MSCFGEHFWGEKNQGFDVLYHNMKHGQVSTKELADFVRERATVEETYAKSMAKLAKMAANSTQLGTFAPLWEVFRISSDKLALCHLELVRKLQDLLREVARYGEEQGKVHKKSKEEVSGTLEAIQLLQGVAQMLPKSKENYHSKCLESERLRREGTHQKEMDKAELKSKKAAEALRRVVEKYNVARADFEQRMLDSATRFQEMEELHLRHMKGLISSYLHSLEDTHVQIGQVHEEFKQNVENIGVAALLQRFAQSKGTGCERPGALDFEECRAAPAQEGPKRSRSKAFRIPGLSRRERERDAVESPDADLTCPDVDEEGFTVRPDITQNSSGGPHGCSSSDSDYEDEDEHPKIYVRIKPLQPCDAAGSGQAAVEQLKATVGNLPLPPGSGDTVKRQVCRHLSAATSVTVAVDSDMAPGTGDEPGKPQLRYPAAWTPSCAGKPRSEAALSAALFGPPLESAFEAEDFTASRACGLTSSPSPFSSSSPENVEDSGLDSPSHPATGPSPDSRPWTPQSPLARRPARGSPRLPEERHARLPTTVASEEQSAWLPWPSSPAGWPRDTPCFATFSGSEPSGEDAGAQHGSRCPSAAAPSPDPCGDPPARETRPQSPVSDQAPQRCQHGACPPSTSVSSPVPPSGREPSSPLPWTCLGPGSRLSDGSAPAAPDPQADPVPLPEPVSPVDLWPFSLRSGQPERAQLLHGLAAGAWSLPRPQPCGAGVPGCATRGNRLHGVHPRLLQGPGPRQVSGEDHGRAHHVLPRRHRPRAQREPGPARPQLPPAEHGAHRAVPAQRRAAVQRPVPERPQHQGLLAEHGGADRAPAEAGRAGPRGLLLQRGPPQVPVLQAGPGLGPPAAGRALGLHGGRHPGQRGVRLQRRRHGRAPAPQQRPGAAARGGASRQRPAAACGQLEPGGEAAAVAAAGRSWGPRSWR